MKLIKDKNFYKMLFAICIPIALQNVITQATSIADTLMLGAADSSGALLSASSLANNPFFILSLVCFGLASGSAILSAQYWGKNDLPAIRTIISMVVKLGAAIGLIFGLIVIIFPEQVMRIFSNNEIFINAGAQYLKIIGFAYAFFAFGNTLLCALRGVEIVKISVVVNLSGLVTNIFLNWVLIFGNLGAPAMGIKGAAVATLIARLVEFTVTVVYVFGIDKKLGLRLRHLLRFNKLLAHDLVKYSTPVVINEVMWSLAISMQAVILGHIEYSSGDPVASNTIAAMIYQLASVVIFGVANAAAVVVGKAIGEKQEQQALERAHTLKLMSLLLGVLTFGIILLLRPLILGLYDLPEQTIALTHDMIFVTAVTSIFVSIASVSIVGILRGAGDTRFCLIIELVLLWGVAIPAALIAVYFRLPVPLVLALMKSDELLKAVVCLIRLHGKKWLNSVTRDKLNIAQ
ncbi:MAG: MATE family efflux transporter [Clostridia bacterium]|nr:MATE family efflux transporter [Clostridia bacterium]